MLSAAEVEFVGWGTRPGDLVSHFSAGRDVVAEQLMEVGEQTIIPQGGSALTRACGYMLRPQPGQHSSASTATWE